MIRVALFGGDYVKAAAEIDGTARKKRVSGLQKSPLLIDQCCVTRIYQI